MLLGRASPHGVIEKSSPCSDDKQVSSLTIRMVLYRIIIIIIIIIIVIQSQHMTQLFNCPKIIHFAAIESNFNGFVSCLL